MYCPNLTCPDFKKTGVPGEYVEGITVCPFCGSNLVEQPPNIGPVEEPRETDHDEAWLDTAEALDEELIVVASYNYRHDADLMMTFLSNQGINVFQSPDDCGGTDPAVGFSTRTRLLSPKSQAEQAVALINEVEETCEEAGE